MFGSGQIKGYGLLGLNGQTAEFDDGDSTVSVSGVGFTQGAGGMYSLSEKLGLNIGARYTMGSIDEIEADGVTINIKDLFGESIDTTSLRLNVGVTIFL